MKPRRNKSPTRPLSISESMEHYLAAILSITEQSGVARVRDIGKELGVRLPSVTNAINSLVKGGYVRHENYGHIELTAAGAKAAKKVSRRRKILLRFLTEILEVDAKAAEADACGMEHCLSEKTLERLVSFLDFMDFAGEAKGRQCIKHLKAFYEGRGETKCLGCISE